MSFACPASVPIWESIASYIPAIDIVPSSRTLAKFKLTILEALEPSPEPDVLPETARPFSSFLPIAAPINDGS